jgi:hypothetical protein
MTFGNNTLIEYNGEQYYVRGHVFGDRYMFAGYMVPVSECRVISDEPWPTIFLDGPLHIGDTFHSEEYGTLQIVNGGTHGYKSVREDGFLAKVQVRPGVK